MLPASDAAVDAAALKALEAASPAALELSKRADAAFDKAAFAEAARLYGEAVDLAPRAALLKRQKCRALAQLGKRREAIELCRGALEQGARSAFDIRVLTGVLVAGREQPTPPELAQAYQFASLAIRQESEQPWGYAAMCDLAERVGDDSLMATNLWQLQQVAPAHAETKALEARTAGRRGLVGLVLGWLGLLAFTAVTVWRALRLRRSAPVPRGST